MSATPGRFLSTHFSGQANTGQSPTATTSMGASSSFMGSRGDFGQRPPRAISMSPDAGATSQVFGTPLTAGRSRHSISTPATGRAPPGTGARSMARPYGAAGAGRAQMQDTAYAPPLESLYDDYDSAVPFTAPSAAEAGFERSFAAHLPSDSIDALSDIAPAEGDNSLDVWVTVFGFPPTAASLVLSYLEQCGDIVRHMMAPDGGNWMHVRFKSHLQAERAISRNRKVVARSIMLGVAPCEDRGVLAGDKSAAAGLDLTAPRALHNASQRSRRDIDVFSTGYTSKAPQKVNPSLFRQTIEYIFNW
ncbi:hypothetical protein CAOG_003038 [Capsaspora owczarzaki ATCC 30864]|uniref:RRM Nup35-type domain-containing protein n=1 Tax=Capsaspora owczarzaki (strain ATCC 30864) TaxID=595528 RepID=A0A0D2VNR2_CAPO3|nr:hypothetical protein CAOG_003038 [Capsaspora owczarzaki ATCC 30864]